MSTEKEFPAGLIFKLPRDGAPDYVIGSLSIKVEEFLEWLNGRDGDWVNLNLKRAQSGKAYAEVDTWKPDKGGNVAKAGAKSAPKPAPAFADDTDIPF